MCRQLRPRGPGHAPGRAHQEQHRRQRRGRRQRSGQGRAVRRQGAPHRRPAPEELNERSSTRPKAQPQIDGGHHADHDVAPNGTHCDSIAPALSRIATIELKQGGMDMQSYKYTVGALATTLTLLGSSATAQVTLNANTWLPPTHLLVADVMMPFCTDVEAATQGRVKCNLLAKAVVGPVQTLDAVKDGLADLSFIETV